MEPDQPSVGSHIDFPFAFLLDSHFDAEEPQANDNAVRDSIWYVHIPQYGAFSFDLSYNAHLFAVRANEALCETVLMSTRRRLHDKAMELEIYPQSLKYLLAHLAFLFGETPESHKACELSCDIVLQGRTMCLFACKQADTLLDAVFIDANVREWCMPRPPSDVGALINRGFSLRSELLRKYEHIYEFILNEIAANPNNEWHLSSSPPISWKKNWRQWAKKNEWDHVRQTRAVFNAIDEMSPTTYHEYPFVKPLFFEKRTVSSLDYRIPTKAPTKRVCEYRIHPGYLMCAQVMKTQF